MNIIAQDFTLDTRDDGVCFGVLYTPKPSFKSGFIFYHDYSAAGDRCFETEMPLSAKQMDLVMEWWQKERLNFIKTEEN